MYTYTHISRCTRSYTYARGRPHMRVPTRLRTHTRARIGGAAAHNGPRRTDDRPSASRLRWRAARAGKAAHTLAKLVIRAVFHAPMSALNALAPSNACAPSHPRSTPTGRRSHVSARMRARPIAHVRARTQHAGACVRRARIGDPFVGVARRAWI
jgi:hypothetical protein